MHTDGHETGQDSRMVEIPRPPVVEKAVAVRVVLSQESPAESEEALHELRELARTAGADIVCTFEQHRSSPDPATYIGGGKLDAIKAAIGELDAETVLFDADLGAAQGVKLEKALGVKVVDRTQLILDIFAGRAQTREGRMQVELAQLQYLLPRLTGRGSIMRQQGGIGVRGPGEQKLEVDRRVIRGRITRLKAELEEVRKHRRVQRDRRVAQGIPTVALVGYTNAGKSSLLNALTGADALAEDKLFATLDPLVRRCALPGGGEALFADTVGFVRRLPHTLVAAFRATLEAVNEADLLLLVLDASHPAMEEHLRTVRNVLEEIGAAAIPFVKVYNKADLLDEGLLTGLTSDRAPHAVVSALRGDGLRALLEMTQDQLRRGRTHLRLRVPQDRAAVLSQLRARARILEIRYEGNDVLVDAEVEAGAAGRFAEWAEIGEGGEA